MSISNDKGGPPQGPRKVEINTNIDLGTQLVTFTEVKVNGIINLNPPAMAIPFKSIIIIAAQILLAMNGVATGASRQETGPDTGTRPM